MQRQITYHVTPEDYQKGYFVVPTEALPDNRGYLELPVPAPCQTGDTVYLPALIPYE